MAAAAPASASASASASPVASSFACTVRSKPCSVPRRSILLSSGASLLLLLPLPPALSSTTSSSSTVSSSDRIAGTVDRAVRRDGDPLHLLLASADDDDDDDELSRIEPLLSQAAEAWAKAFDPNNDTRTKDYNLDLANRLFDKIVALDPLHTEWLEARGQFRIDAKRFKEAILDFDEVVRRSPKNFKAYSGRALAYEGLAEWEKAVLDYTRALEQVQLSTGSIDPYIANSRGNAFSSLGRYSEALQDYLLSLQGFQKAKELDGAIYAASNAALMRVQLGDEAKAMKELMSVARRAPASIDMRAALAALYWSKGQEQAAEDEWRFTCENINSGQLFDSCALYTDSDWLRRIRRWPPVMVERMQNFLQLRSSSP